MFQGCMVALVTPMHPDGSLDYDALQRLVEFHIENGTAAIVAMGTTGESATLDMEEHCEVITRVVQFASGRIPVIAGTGANSTSEAVELTQSAERSGADAALLVTPYYNKPTQEGLYLHYQAVADAVAIPQILYNVPGRTAIDMHDETTARLAHIPNIVGIKDATGDVSRLRSLMALCPDDFALLSGDDATSREFVLAGGVGAISVTANIVPGVMQQMLMAALEGDADKAASLDASVCELHQVLFVESNPIPVKWALQQMGLISSGIRLPLTRLSDAFHQHVKQALVRAGAI